MNNDITRSNYIESHYTVYDISLCIIQKLLSIYIERKKFVILLDILHKRFLTVKIILNQLII
jgi:hypothetical protein